MLDSEMPYPWPEPSPDPEQPFVNRRRAGPTGGFITDPVALAKRRAAQKAQRAARRRNRT